MTAYGTRRHLYDPKMQTDKPFDQTTISLQMGTNKGASQVSRTVCDACGAVTPLSLGEAGGTGGSVSSRVLTGSSSERVHFSCAFMQ